MVSSHWEKRNTHIWYSGLALITVIFLVVATFTTWFGIAKNGVTLLATLLSMAAIFSVTRALMNRHPQSLVRTLKLEYEPALFALRKLFKEKQIRFDKRTEEDESMRFDFPGQDVTMTVKQGMSGSVVREVGIRPYTVLTIQGANTKYEPFIELLAQSIDEMAESILQGK